MYVRLLTNNFLSEKAVGKSESKDVHLAVLRVLPEVIRESVDADASSKSVIIYDPATGEKKMVSPTAVDGIESLGEVKTAEQTEAEINARMQDTIQRGKDWLEGNVANPVGMQIQLGDGRIATIEAMHEDGKSAIATLPDGTQFLVPKDVLQRIVNNGQYADYKARRDAEASKRETEQGTESAPETATEGGQPLPEEASTKEEESREYAQGDVFDVVVDGNKMHAEIVSPKDADGRFVVNVDDGESMRTLYVTPEELAAMEYREEPSTKVEETRLATDGSSEKALERGEQPTEEHTPTALERIPRDEKGNAQFHDVDTETAWDGLVEMSGNEETAHKVAEASLANAEKRLKAAKALKEKGETPEELLRSIRENEAAVAEAQRTVDAWKAIVGEKARREEAAKAEAERIATEKTEAERKAAEERERAEAEEKTRIEAEKKEAERIAAEKAEEEARVEAERKAEEEARVEAERKAEEKTEEAESDKEEAEKQMDDEEPKPVGSGVFGNIYNQFKGKVKEAFDFLMKHKGGDLLGVFHRKDVGDIDLVWGDENGGLAHILHKHVGEGKSFANVDEAMSHIQNIIGTGKNDFEDGDKIVFRKGSELVTVRKNFREGGKKIADKNWVLTAYDKEAADNGNRVTTKVIEGKATPHTASIDKGSKKAEKKQKKQSVFDKAKEIADKEVKKRKAEAEDDSVLGQATRAVGKKKKVNLFKYTASEKNSYPTLRGVHYANGYAYASDGYILFKEKADYPKEWEGTTRDKDGNLVDGKYPDAEKAIHRLVHIPDKEVESLPSKGVLDFAIAAGKKLKVEAIPVAVDGIFFNAVALKKFLEAVASKGMDRVVYRHPMLYATNGKDEIVMMPTVNTLEGALDIADRMERAGLPKEQIDAWKAHIEAADKKMSFEDFKKAVENAKKEGVRHTEAEKPKEQPLTEAERKDAEEVAGALGYRVEWVDTMEENGTIDADKKVIRIAKDAENPLVQVLGHEVAHGVRRMIGGKFRALQKAAKEVVGEKEWNERIEKKRKLNAYAEGKLAEEVTCDIVGEALNNKDALKRLAESLRGERGILARLRDAVVRMVEYFKNRGDKEGVRRMKAADRLLAEFESALKEGEGVNRSAREAENENVERSVRKSRSEKTELTEEERELRDNLVERTRAMAVKKANDRFNEELEMQVKGELEEGHVYKLGMPSEILLSTGVPNLPIQMSAQRLEDKATKFGHNFDIAEVKDLVNAIQKPIAIFEYGDRNKSQNLIVEIQKDGKNFIIGLSLNPVVKGKALEINSVRNVFPKDNAEWLNWISQNKLLYADKEKIQALIDKQQTNLADVNYLNLDDVTKKVKDFENTKLFDGKISEVDKKGSDSIDRSVRENPKNEDKPRFSRKPGESIFDYASRVSEDVDRSVRERVSARDEYEKKVKSKGFQTKEALQNSMLGLQEFMLAIDHASGNKRYIEDIPDFENPILGENRLSSVNKEEMHQVAKTQFKPLMSAVAKLSGNGKESGELYDYMFAKHGLERDAVMRQREAQKEFDKYQKANPKGTKTIGDFVASLEGKDYAGLTALTAEDGRVKSIQSQIDTIDEQMKATDDQLLLRKLGGQKKRLKVDLLNAARDAADDIRKAFESNPSHDRSDINELWSRVNEVNGNTLRKLYESGMLTKEAYNDISSMYTNYIPMRGFDQTTSADAYAYLTHGDSAFNAPIKTAKGRSSKADNPIAYMQAMAESAIMQGNRNVLVKQKMLNFVRNHPSDLASVSDVWLQYDSVADEWKPFYAFGRESKG